MALEKWGSFDLSVIIGNLFCCWNLNFDVWLKCICEMWVKCGGLKCEMMASSILWGISKVCGRDDVLGFWGLWEG